jgi:hypothetical protein
MHGTWQTEPGQALTSLDAFLHQNISMEPSTLGHLQAANAFGTLVPMLKRTGFPCDQDVENQVLQSMFYLCRISRKRQERAAVAGLVPYLQRCILEESHLKQFALQIMCDLAHSTAAAREILWQQNGAWLAGPCGAADPPNYQTTLSRGHPPPPLSHRDGLLSIHHCQPTGPALAHDRFSLHFRMVRPIGWLARAYLPPPPLTPSHHAGC